MISRRIVCRWILQTVRFLVMEVIMPRVLDDYILGPLASWLGVREEDNMEGTVGAEGVEGSESLYGREGGRA